MGPKMDTLSLRYFGLPPAQPLLLALADPTDRYLRVWKPVPVCLQFDQQRVLSRFFLPPSPSFSLFQRPPSPSWRNKKPRLGSWKLEPNPTVIREGRTERKTALETICGAVFDSTLTSDCPDFEFADRATILELEANIQKRVATELPGLLCRVVDRHIYGR